MTKPNHLLKAAFHAAFPLTLPIMAGFFFLGTAYGIYMKVSGFAAIYPILMSMLIFAGSMEFVAATLLLGPFDPLAAFLLTLMVNARHLFYGLSMLDKYSFVGPKRWYLIFGMCDESFSINCTTPVPEGIDRGWFYFFVTLLNQCYWVFGATMGSIFGSYLSFNAQGLEFVMTALLVVIFVENWMREDHHITSLVGLGISLICLLLFGGSSFIVPSMLCILLALSFFRKQLAPQYGALEETDL